MARMRLKAVVMAVIWQFRLRRLTRLRLDMTTMWLMSEHRPRPRVGHARHPHSDSSDTDEDPIMPWEVDYGPW